MSETKWTPEPWIKEWTSGDAINITDGRGNLIAQLWGHEDQDDNANLIMAAPALAEALRAIVAFDDETWVDPSEASEDWIALMQSVRAALALAEKGGE